MADWNDIGGRARNLALAGLVKARDIGESAKLSLDNLSEEEALKKIYAEIGRLYVASHPEPEEGYEELYRQLAESEDKLEQNKSRIASLKE